MSRRRRSSQFRPREDDTTDDMDGWLSFFAPLALLIPSPAAFADGDDVSKANRAAAPVQEGEEAGPWSPPASQTLPMQVRIESRVVIRVSPARQRSQLLASLPTRGLSRMAEKRMDDCVPMNGVVGVQTAGESKLVLYMRDRRLVSAHLEKACMARDFYSGFYVEPTKDGKLCSGRDKLQARSGTKCEIARMRQLVAVED